MTLKRKVGLLIWFVIFVVFVPAGLFSGESTLLQRILMAVFIIIPTAGVTLLRTLIWTER